MPEVKQWNWQRRDWPKFTWDMEQLWEPLSKARMAQGKLLGIRGFLLPELISGAMREILANEACCTSAIEGLRLDPDEVAAAVAHCFEAVKTSEARFVPPEAHGIVSVLLDAVERRENPLTKERLCAWQPALFPDRHLIATGRLRTTGVSVQSGAEGQVVTHYVGIPPERLERDLTAFLDWFNDSKGQIDGLIRAGLAQLWFVSIHPFADGNGRLARVLTDLALAQDEGDNYSLLRMSASILRTRESYYAALREAQSFEAKMSATRWLRWFLDQLTASCECSEAMLDRTISKARFWIRFKSAPFNERQLTILNLLLNSGKLDIHANLTNRKYVAATKAAKATAFRDISELIELGCLEQTGSGRSVSYQIPWERI